MTYQEQFDARPRVKKKIGRLPENPDQDVLSSSTLLGRFPKWLHRKMPKGGDLPQTSKILEEYQLNTVCEEAKCPNRIECYSKKTATFLACGSACTRACGFCDIDFAKQPLPLAEDEPKRIALSSKKLGLKHVVITMVARDDLPDQASHHIANIIREVRLENPGCTVEVLTSDFSGDVDAIQTVLDETPEIFNHNLETVRRLTPRVRHKATYERTLMLLQYVKTHQKKTLVKSGIMVGLGETEEEVLETLDDLKGVGCDIVTIGHYLQASKNKLGVKQFVTPDTFSRYEEYGQKIGIGHTYSGPFVRSSYNAEAVLEKFYDR